MAIHGLRLHFTKVLINIIGCLNGISVYQVFTRVDHFICVAVNLRLDCNKHSLRKKYKFLCNYFRTDCYIVTKRTKRIIVETARESSYIPSTHLFMWVLFYYHLFICYVFIRDVFCTEWLVIVLLNRDCRITYFFMPNFISIVKI